MMNDHWGGEDGFQDEGGDAGDSGSHGPSVSNTILEEVSGFEVFSEDELAARLHLDKRVVLEQLYDLRSRGLIDGTEGAWTRDFEHGALPEPDDEYIF